MKILKKSKHSYSLLTLVALGSLTCANLNAQALLEALEGSTISGNTGIRLTSTFGRDINNGSSFRLRSYLDFETGTYKGVNLGTSVFLTKGSSSTENGTFLQNSGNPYDLIAVRLMKIYGRMTFESTATTVITGQMDIQTPFSDPYWDKGYGVSIRNADLPGLTFQFDTHLAWGLDEPSYLESNITLQGFENPKSDNTLVIFGVKGDAKEFGVGFDLWGAHAFGAFDFLIFGGLNYEISGLDLSATLATTKVDTSNRMFKSYGAMATAPHADQQTAAFRGLYNVQASYNLDSTSITAGYTGSFGDGYGVLFNWAAINMGGNLWWDIATNGSNGFGMFGVGGIKNTDIKVGYLSLKYKAMPSLSMSLDYAFVGGNNNYLLPKKAFANNGGRLTKNVTIHEVSAAIRYNINEKLAWFGSAGSMFGDVSLGRVRTELKYFY